jgi:hypothetical protein
LRKHSSDSKDSETLDAESDHSSSGGGNSHGHKSHRKGKRSGKKPSVVVIKNVNVTSKKCGSSESESQSSSEVESADSDNSHSKSRERKHKSSCSKEGRRTTFDPGDEYNKDETSNGHGVEQGNWSAFQNFLLRAEEKTRSSDADLFAGEKEPPSRRKQNVNTADPIILVERDGGNVCEQNKIGFDSANGRTRVIRVMSNDELVMSGEGRIYMDCEMKEIEAGGGRYRRGTGDDYMVYGQGCQIDRHCLLDPLAEAQYKNPVQQDNNRNGVTDESFMIPLRSSSQDNIGAESRTTMDIDVELPSSIHKASDKKAGHQLFYEPDELVPER